jgi:DNA-binding winged helix-turn-helix (wHTH) protein/TolB-like protein
MRFRFGLFDFDPARGELRRDGEPVRLQAQPAQVLAVLLSNAGEVVTRDTLRQAVWGTETFVDFDRGLNFCIAQIRSALSDSAESPRYIRTLAKRGYQFIAPVTKPAQEEAAAAPAITQSTPKARSLSPWLAAAVLVAVLAGLLALRYAPPAPPAIKIAVARFDNETGNPELDRFADGLTDSVVADFTTSGGPRYGVIGNAAVLRQPRERRDLLAIASTLGVSYVILGQVQRDAPGTRILAHLIRLPEQTHLSVFRVECGAGNPLPAQTDIAQQIVAQFTRRLTSAAASPTAVIR